MISAKSSYFKFSKKTKDAWLIVTKNYSGKRAKLKDYFNFFCDSKEDVINKFSIFKKVKIGSSHFQLDIKDLLIHCYLILCKKK